MARHDSEATEMAPDAGPPLSSVIGWPMAEQQGHLSASRLDRRGDRQLREVHIVSVAAVSGLTAGNPAFERHQALRAKRTVLRSGLITLTEGLAAQIPDRAGTSAVLPRFLIFASVVGGLRYRQRLTFAFGYRIEYGIPNAFQPRGPDGPEVGRAFISSKRPLIVPERSVQSEGAMLRLGLSISWPTFIARGARY